MLWDRHPALSWDPADVPKAAVTSGRMLIVDCHETAASTQAARYARDAGIPTIVDVEKVRPGIGDLLQHIDADHRGAGISVRADRTRGAWAARSKRSRASSAPRWSASRSAPRAAWPGAAAAKSAPPPFRSIASTAPAPAMPFAAPSPPAAWDIRAATSKTCLRTPTPWRRSIAGLSAPRRPADA